MATNKEIFDKKKFEVIELLKYRDKKLGEALGVCFEVDWDDAMLIMWKAGYQKGKEDERKEISFCSCGKAYCAKCLQYSNKQIKELRELLMTIQKKLRIGDISLIDQLITEALKEAEKDG